MTRLANVYGGGDLHRSRLIPEAIGAALHGRAPILRSDGSPQRDFLYVDDAVAAYLAIHEAVLEDRPGSRGEAFNASPGEAHRVGDVVAHICRLTGGEVTPEVRGAGRAGGAVFEIERQWLDSTRLTELTGWRARIGLEEGLRRTIEWYRGHPEALSRLL